MSERERLRLETPHLGDCPFCRDGVRMADAKRACEQCAAWHHRECWDEHGRCAACGHAPRAVAAEPATSAPPTSPLEDERAPAPWRVDGQRRRPLGPCRAPGCRELALEAGSGELLATYCATHAIEPLRARAGLFAWGVGGVVTAQLGLAAALGPFAFVLSPLVIAAGAIGLVARFALLERAASLEASCRSPEEASADPPGEGETRADGL